MGVGSGGDVWLYAPYQKRWKLKTARTTDARVTAWDLDVEKLAAELS